MQMIMPQSHKQHNSCRHAVLSWKNNVPSMRRDTLHAPCIGLTTDPPPNASANGRIKHRVSPDSHHTTHSLFDIYLLFLLVSFWATELSGVSPRVSYTLRHFLGFHRWIRCLTRFSGFSPEGGIYPLLAMPDTFHFPFSFNTM